MTTFNTKLGKTRAGERTRIWIEGNRLIEAGFTVGQRFAKAWSATGLVVTLTSEPAKGLGTVSGKGDKPIIDITGQLVAATFGAGTHVTVTYQPGLIVIAPAVMEG